MELGYGGTSGATGLGHNGTQWDLDTAGLGYNGLGRNGIQWDLGTAGLGVQRDWDATVHNGTWVQRDLGYNGTETQRYTMGLGYSGTWGTTELGHNGILELGHKGTWGTTGLGHCVTVPVSDSRCVPAPLNTCPRLMIRVRVQLGL